MKKRTITKLRLDRETLRILTDTSLQEAVAGAITLGCSGPCTKTAPHALSKDVGCN